jgi:DNA-binding YbaB/EbfC family protein
MAMNMQQIMRQARKMQEQLAAAQEGLKDIEVSASAGGGMVKVTATADGMLSSITIDPDALDPEDVDLIQDTILAAVNEALSSAREAADQQMGAVTGGMGLPGMPGMF